MNEIAWHNRNAFSGNVTIKSRPTNLVSRTSSSCRQPADFPLNDILASAALTSSSELDVATVSREETKSVRALENQLSPVIEVDPRRVVMRHNVKVETPTHGVS